MDITIGVFDSGVGGFTVVRELKKLLPCQPLIYFGDTARTPYGTKGHETLIQYAREDTKFLLKHGADLIVIACHSAASAATLALRQEFTVPIFEVVSPSVNQAIAVTRRKVIGLIGTRATVTSGVYKNAILSRLSDAKVYSQACPLLVPLVEEGWLKAKETRMIVKKYLRPLRDRQIDTLILGCTHYPLLKEIIQEKAGKRVSIVDASAEVARAVYSYIEEKGQLSKKRIASKDCFFVSDLTPATQEVARLFLGNQVRLEMASLACKG
ncbi:MAG: glutamate racemase [Nitrospiraceae bacterium]|nr:glutamate racemase [Nitrospiraceae bacterium]